MGSVASSELHINSNFTWSDESEPLDFCCALSKLKKTKASTHQRSLAIIFTKDYGNSVQIWGLGVLVAAEAQQEAVTSMKRYVLLSRDRYLRDRTSLEDVVTP